MISLSASLTALWHVGLGYSLGSAVDALFPSYPQAFPSASAPNQKKSSIVLLEAAGQIVLGYAALTEVMILLADASTPIGDGISSAAFFYAQPNLIAKLQGLRCVASTAVQGLRSDLPPAAAGSVKPAPTAQ